MARRTAKQKAATRKLVALNKRRRGRKSSTIKRKRTKIRKGSRRTKVITKVRRVTSMARRRTSKRRSTSRSSGIVGTVKRFAKPIAIGLGVPAVVGIAGSAVGQPQLGGNKLLNAGAAFLLGGPVAGGAALLLGGGLGNLFGGGNNANMEGLA